MKILLITLSTLAVATTLSFAQDKPAGPPAGHGGPGGPGNGQRPSPEEMFKKLDTNKDGVLSLDEFKASPRGQKDPAKAEALFKELDKNGDGKVTLEEFKAHRPAGGHGKGGQGGPGKGGQGRAGGA